MRGGLAERAVDRCLRGRRVTGRVQLRRVEASGPALTVPGVGDGEHAAGFQLGPGAVLADGLADGLEHVAAHIQGADAVVILDPRVTAGGLDVDDDLLPGLAVLPELGLAGVEFPLLLHLGRAGDGAAHGGAGRLELRGGDSAGEQEFVGVVGSHGAVLLFRCYAIRDSALDSAGLAGSRWPGHPLARYRLPGRSHGQ